MSDEPRKLNVLFNSTDRGGCLFYRGYLPMAYLNHVGKVNGYTTNAVLDYEWFGGDSDKRRVQVLGMQRPTSSHQMPLINRWGPITYVDIDDDFFNLDPSNPCYWDMAESLRRTGEDPIEIHAEALKSCEIVTVSTQPLAESVLKKTGRKGNVVVVPNGYHCPISDYDIELQRGASLGRPIRIGWWGGFHHIGDFNSEILHGLNQLIDKYGDNVQVIFLGWAPIELLGGGKIIFQPWTHVTEFYETLYNLDLDICIGPLADTEFNRAKSNIKFQETAMFGRCFVTNQHEVFSDLVDGENAAVVDKVGDIPAALEYLIEHRSEINEIGARAKKFADEKYHIRHMADGWMRVFEHLASRGTQYHFKLSESEEKLYQESKSQLPIEHFEQMFARPHCLTDKASFRFDWRK